MRRRLRRGWIPALALVAAVSPVALTRGTAASAATVDRDAADRAATWMASKLVDGRYPNPMGAGADQGLMVDAVLGLHAAGRDDLAEPIVDVLDGGGEVQELISYSSWRGRPDPNRLGGATAKALVAAVVADRDPRSFGGLDLVAELHGVITPDGPERGRVRDHGPDIGINNANTFGQAFAVLGLGHLGEQRPDVVAQLLRQQCSEGYFRIFYSSNADGSPATCDEGKARDRSAPDRDSTGIALSAMLASRDAGTTGLDGPIDQARSWLVAAQQPDGGWGGGVGTEAANTNSTGLVVQALADAGGADAAVARGRSFLRSAQVAAADARTDLGGELGAIAYQPSERVAARSGGIVGVDTWIRASAQAVLGLAEVGFVDLLAGRRPPPVPTTSTTAPPAVPANPTRPSTTAPPTVPTRANPGDPAAPSATVRATSRATTRSSNAVGQVSPASPSPSANGDVEAKGEPEASAVQSSQILADDLDASDTAATSTSSGRRSWWPWLLAGGLLIALAAVAGRFLPSLSERRTRS